MSVFGNFLVRIFLHSDCIHSECRKIRTRKTPNTGTIHAVSAIRYGTKIASYSCSIILNLFATKTRNITTPTTELPKLSKRVFKKLLLNTKNIYHALTLRKNCPYRSYSGLYFPEFGLNTERYGVSPRIQSECWKMRTRITPNTDNFHAV